MSRRYLDTGFRKPRPRIRSATPARQKQLREYRKLKADFLATRSACFHCGEYVPPQDRELHHWAGRTGALLCWWPGFRMVSKEHHKWIESHRKEAIELGLRAPENLFGRPSKVIK